MQGSAELYEKLFPQEYVSKCLESGVRPDARKLLQSRHVTINWTQSGSCLVKLGASCALASVKLAVGTPALATPDQGEIDLQVLFPGVCASKFSTQRTTDEAQSLSSYITRALLSCKCVDLRDCSIERGKSAWKVMVEVTFLDHDGNALDTALLAVMSVLSKLTLPAISISSDSIVSLAEDQSAKVLFPLHATLFSTTFGEYQSHVMVDPTAREEEVLESTFSVLTTKSGDFAGVYKSGGVPLAPATLQVCIQVAKERTAAIVALMEQSSTSD
ncbi:hypothetical protein H310_02233 [Aphanomyces invadans]|uniref:Ribosomal RNA-processing protein 43 n=1 Tax=Aphanomyces invadans TaxID=157072 RepID=A0A024UNN9_9STRA|nr:hypothetical protein H310_02233 [Aphanomyces invadans]ETW07805.1 hypothetical protein H310_02233 [Aphanomyces invadans]|eukprot:XP_008863898.1 hypothetical protein H310_02233 [Aphanomyces invadans]